ncbi:UV DNA damage repair endonuclease UvsE [Rubrobacter marinus]|uniref:UV DNA damage repair endonuclease UvsE n=1 Tax=Rubrobacter marinus TaxID=2653852 RepID=A0A6G8PWW7_9ACTN|nr:UV DNA damage repair endonuclease UvsE [Rubrobacter marinus]QIN78686.1 UV DNA damage repair endonuclease UvsE [Rubrobacter marinus]
MIRLGYPAQNLAIPAGTNHTCRLASLPDAEKVRALVWENITALETIIRWNAERGISLFRMGQAMVPFASHPAFPYDWEEEHGEDFRWIGGLARSLGVRLSMHPGQFIQPGSPKPGTSERSLAELRYVARLFDLLGSDDSVMVLHMGGAYEDRAETARRFVEVMAPHAEILKYLALENDERVWPIGDIVATASALGVPAILDSFHHGIHPGGLTLGEAVDLALPTWAGHGRPKLHLSSQDPEKRPGGHAYLVDPADYETLLIALDGREADVMVEAKGKEEALVALGVELGV